MYFGPAPQQYRQSSPLTIDEARAEAKRLFGQYGDAWIDEFDDCCIGERELLGSKRFLWWSWPVYGVNCARATGRTFEDAFADHTRAESRRKKEAAALDFQAARVRDNLRRAAARAAEKTAAQKSEELRQEIEETTCEPCKGWGVDDQQETCLICGSSGSTRRETDKGPG